MFQKAKKIYKYSYNHDTLSGKDIMITFSKNYVIPDPQSIFADFRTFKDLKFRPNLLIFK